MKRFTASIQTRPPLCYWPLLITLAVILCASGSWAAPSTPASSMTPRAKLDRILACQQTEKDAALAEKRKTQDTMAAVESFIGSLSDQPKHYAAHERANRALTLAREALAKIDERLQLADRKIGMTVRALQYLAPAQSGVTRALFLPTCHDNTQIGSRTAKTKVATSMVYSERNTALSQILPCCNG
ncbi:MAG: hypothetical protein NT179_06340 [Nitrospirae bacterium]|nr:hypothetical protein [Nitrospirota bacterium]